LQLFIASVGPGYNDTRIRPWNGGATGGREGGRLYERAWRHAIEADADIISITSYNEWGEGTQIEPAIPAVRKQEVDTVFRVVAPPI
jgi:hypothetical protein